MSRRDLRLVPVAAAAWAVALTCAFLPAAGWWLVAGAFVVGTVLVVVAWKSYRHGWAPLAALACAGAAAVALTCALAAPVRADAAALDGRIVSVEAEVTSSSTIGSDGRSWFDAQTVLIGPTGSERALSIPVRVGIDGLDGADLGARIRVLGQVMASEPSERAALVVFASSAEVPAPARGLFAVAATTRAEFVERAARLPEPGAALLPGLAVGDTTAVSAELNDAMLTSGLSHLTAVSGANCAIVVAAAFWLVALCGGGRRLRVLVALGALASFVVLVTPEPSVIRAGTMAALGMLSILLGKPTAGVSVLCLAIVGILVADPWLAATPGFALSAAATGALILLAPSIARGLGRWLPQVLALGIAVPIAAQLVCGPIIALFAEQQSLIGVAANMLAAPAAPIATVVGLLACLAAPVPAVADALAAAAWLPAAWIATTATTTAQIPGAELLVVPGLATSAIVLVLSAACAIVLCRGRSGSVPPRSLLRSASAVLVIALALGGARVVLDGPLAVVAVPEHWSIAACDVGQGDALVIRSDARIAVIDTGPEPEPLSRCLGSLGVDHVDLLVLTHFDLDHAGGAAALIGRVDTVLHGPVGEPEDRHLLSELMTGGAALVEASVGQSGQLGTAQWRVLWPRAQQAAFPSGNDASVVMEFEGADLPRSLFLGDLSATPQRLLAASGMLRPPYPVVKVAHHGSADQDAGLYALLDPAIAIVNVGIDNDYGHPREETLDLVAAAGAITLRTDLQGRVLVGRRDDELVVWSERSDAGDAPAEVGGPG
ncbi:ComEC/Rec2 family competence protein [Microbacterium sp. M28]|uniref:ComEC/Rec2 family competence protein n=1 Tax=Microbacterium sp. M28 TaxID=2962064 RepID=UPI0021F3D5D3|nr:ComEC/Rec2 family competence protein [Microbacterium sp. M28]UYO95763.1 ComEC/Rec2 family competence protein [Microbacterium sp. M28]